MARDWNSYFRLIRALMPRGRAWSPDTGTLKEVLQAEGYELARVDARVDSLLLERNTLTTTELLDEFKAEFGVPDGCTDVSAYTAAEMRTYLNAKLLTVGSLMPQYYIGLAEALGYTGVTIDVFTPFWSGLGVSGDPCGDQSNIFHWHINWTYDMTKPGQDGDDIDCIVQRFKPAHTVVAVNRVGPPFDNAFSTAFYAMPAADLTVGAFTLEFDKAFDVAWGGGFDATAFADAFKKPGGSYFGY